MANKRARALDRQEFELIINTIRTGFTTKTGNRVRPNNRIATALVLEANLGLRIGDILKLRLCDIVFEGGRHHLQIREQKTGKERNFLVQSEVYIFIQNYAIERGINPKMKLFDISVKAVQNHLKMACDYLGLQGVSSHSFRKTFAQEIFKSNSYDITIIKELLQHSSIAVTQRYLGATSQAIEQALQNHVVLPV